MKKVIELKSQDGYIVILASLLILALLTVGGLSASRISNTEVTMAKNEIVYTRNFYLAEGAALEAADRLNFYGNLNDHPQPWMETVSGNLDLNTLKNYWDNSAADGDTIIPEPSEADPNHTLFLAGDEGIAPGSSLDMARPTVHSLAVYGRCSWDGVAIIKLGYRAAY